MELFSNYTLMLSPSMKFFMISKRYAKGKQDIPKKLWYFSTYFWHLKKIKKVLDKEKMLKNQMFCHMTANTIYSIE